MVVARHLNSPLPCINFIMEVTIYKIETATAHRQYKGITRTWLSYDSTVYDTAVEAQKFYGRQCKRLKHKDVPWKSVTLSRITFKGTPRQIAICAYGQKQFTSETLEVYERAVL